jgi:hypothetical protein
LFQTDPVHAAASEASNHSSEVSAGLNYRDSKRWMHEQRARLGVSVDKLKKLASGRPARQMRHVRFTWGPGGRLARSAAREQGGGVEESRSTHTATEHDEMRSGVVPPPFLIPIHMHACRCETLQRGKGAKANKKQRTKLLLAIAWYTYIFCCSIYFNGETKTPPPVQRSEAHGSWVTRHTAGPT